MKIFEWMAELRYRNKILYQVGLINLILGCLLIIPFLLDPRHVMGINAWIKPIKFCLSLWIYCWTMGWILFDLPKSMRWVKPMSWTIGVTMLIEIGIVIYQASRATRSHFNFETNFDSLLFGMMGLLIAINTIVVIIAFLLYLFKKPNIDKGYLMAVKLGLAIFLLASWIGGKMISNEGHSVGVPDGGEGLPFVNWSTLGGDLRVGHFLGLHALQVIPFFAFLLYKKTSLSANVRMLATIVFGLVYAGLVSYLYVQAANGIPFISAS